jgi:hypothetical protein
MDTATLTSPAIDWRELAARRGDGLEVTLMWSPATGSVQLSVLDVRSGALLVRDVPRDAAMDAFAHPFVYAEPAVSRRVVETAPG